MNAFEMTCAIERKRGYFAHLAVRGDGQWTCTLECGVDVLAERLPRPHGIGETAFIALTLAIRSRDKMKAEKAA